MCNKRCNLVEKIAKKLDITVDSLKKHLLLFVCIMIVATIIISIIILICSRPAFGFWKDWDIIELFEPENWIGWWINAISISVSTFLTYSVFKHNKTQKVLEEKKLQEMKDQEEKREKKAALIAWATYLQVKSLDIVPIHIMDLKSQEIFSKLKLESTKKKVIKVTMTSSIIMPMGYVFDVESVKISAVKRLMDTDNWEEYEQTFCEVSSFQNLREWEHPEEINLIYETFVLKNETVLNIYFVYNADDECLTQIEYYDKFHRHITDVNWEVTGSIYEQNDKNTKTCLCILLNSEVKITTEAKKLEVIKVNYKLIDAD